MRTGHKVRKILVVRNDKLGDFMLAFPALATLKANLPDAEVHALVPRYTREMAEACAWVDKVVEDPGQESGFTGFRRLVRTLRAERYDAAVTLFSTTRIGLALTAARIPYRLAPATKAAQVLYNQRLVQRRSRSVKPEFEYNRDLALQLLADWNIPVATQPGPPYLRFPDDHIGKLRTTFCREHGIEPAHKLVFIHPGHGGSANYVNQAQYVELAAGLRSNTGHGFVITAGPGDLEVARPLAEALRDKGLPTALYMSEQGLRSFAEHLQFADVFVGGSTGPLHIAGALNRPTVGFYPAARVMSALRWRTLNDAERRLEFSPPPGQDDMQCVDMKTAARSVSERFLL